MRSRWMSLFALVMALGLITAACSKKTETPSGGSPEPSTSASASESEGGTITINGDTANNHGEKTITIGETEVEVDDFYFEPTIIKAAPGSDFKVELSNESNNLHNFTLEDQNIDQDIKAGENVDVMVKIPASGQLEFYCKYHKGSGMVGALEAA
jgi:plastocyanin